MNEDKLNIIKNIARDLIPIEDVEDDQERLLIIGTDSIRAVAFIVAIEDEFNIEIDDDIIDPNFFSDYSYIVKRIEEIKKTI